MSARAYRRGIAKHQLPETMNPHANPKHTEASPSVDETEVEGTAVTMHPGPARRVTPVSAMTGERLSARRRELAGKEHKPLTVKIVKPEEKPLMSQKQSSFANNVLLVRDARDSSQFQSARQPDNSLQEPSVSPYQNSLTQKTPGSDAPATAGSAVTPSGHQAAHRHWGKIQE